MKTFGAGADVLPTQTSSFKPNPLLSLASPSYPPPPTLHTPVLSLISSSQDLSGHLSPSAPTSSITSRATPPPSSPLPGASTHLQDPYRRDTVHETTSIHPQQKCHKIRGVWEGL
ncbi:hypothetical protein DXG01_002955 [Tephrocybe rancida]|nr:hypothetical protein DXG01_002955 [Tephrocybe rancida]